MLIRIDDIKDEGLSREFQEPPQAFPVLAEMAESGECVFPAPMHVQVRAIRVADMVEVDGQVETQVRFNCSRCLEDFEFQLSIPFTVTYTRHLPEVESDEEEIEVSAEELGLILFEGDEIDLRQAVQEQVVMAMPLRPLCREGCKGLCPRCGADLNRAECGCERTDTSLKFAALKDFKFENKEDKQE